MIKRYILMFLLAGCGVAVILNGYFSGIRHQSVAMKTFIPIEANIVDKNRSGKHFKLSYQYSVGGRKYTNDRVFTGFSLSGFSSRLNYARFEDIYNKYQIDDTVKIYYNPDKPENSFLIRKVISEVYIEPVFYALLACFILAGFFEYFYCNSIGLKEFDIHPKESILGYNFWKYFFLGCFWNICGIWLISHFFSVAEGEQYTKSGIVIMIIYEVLGVILFSFLIFGKMIASTSDISDENFKQIEG